MDVDPITTRPIGFRAASVDITPDAPCPLGGFAGPPRIWGRIETPIEANAIAFDDGRTLVCLFSLDTLYIGPDLTEWLGRQVGARWPERDTRVLAFASHTHFAPMLDETKPALGRPDGSYVAALKAKLQALIETLAAAPPRGGSWRLAAGEADISVNRRHRAARRTWNSRFRPDPQTFMAPDPAGYVDRRMRIALIEDDAGAVHAAIAHFACHPTSYPDMHAITADYVAAVREAVREACGTETPVLFLQGCAGDVRAAIQGQASAISLLRTIKNGPHFRPATRARWAEWRQEVARSAAAALARRGPKHALAGALRAAEATVPLTELFDAEDGGAGGGETGGAMAMQSADIAGLRILTMTSEPLAGWSRLVPEDVLLAGYSGDCFGYLPLQADVIAGGYEVDGFHAYAGLPALRWRDDFEARVKARITALLDPATA